MKIYYGLVLALLILSVQSCSTDANSEMNPDENPANTTGDPAANRRNVGDSSADLLSANTYTRISFEIFYVNGFRPTDATLENFKQFIQERLQKSGEAEFILTEIASPGQAEYSIEDIRRMEDDIRTRFNQADKIAVFGLFLDGAYDQNTENGSVLGVAYRNTSFVIFDETVRSFSNRPLAPSTTVLQSTVLQHEFGHLLGLVNAGAPLQSAHQDEAHGRHCTVDDCLMYWTAETGEGLLNMISGGSIPTLDAQCIADLQANGGK